MQILLVNNVVFPVTIFFAKASILLLYLRVFYLDRTIRLGVWGGLILQTLFYLTAATLGIVAMCRCSSIETLSNMFCVRYESDIQLTILTFNLVTDIYIIILPIHRVWNLQLNFRRKIGLLTVFVGGILLGLILPAVEVLLTLMNKNIRGRFDSLDHIYSTLSFARYIVAYCH